MHFYFDKSVTELKDSDGLELKLRPQSARVLALLLERQNQIVSKDTIMSTVWVDRVVTEDSVTQCIADIRRVLGPQYRAKLQTVPKKGYRFSNFVDEENSPLIECTTTDERERTNSPADIDEEARPVPRKWLTVGLIGILASVLLGLVLTQVSWIQQRSSISDSAMPRKPLLDHHGSDLVILPFKNTGKHADAQYFIDGITEDIVFALTKFSGLRVMIWNPDANTKSIRTRKQDSLKFRYSVTGSVRRTENRVRVTVQLVDSNNTVLWSDRFEEAIENIFEVQDKVTTQLASALSEKVVEMDARRIANKATKHYRAYDHFLRGRSLRRERTLQSNLLARESFEQALEIDPSYAAVYREMAMAYIDEIQLGWTEWPVETAKEGLDLISKALNLRFDDARSHAALAWFYMYFEKFELTAKAAKKAMELNPNDTFVRNVSGFSLFWTGHPEEAIEDYEYSLQFDPSNPYVLNNMGAAYWVVGRLDDAIYTLEMAVKNQPESSAFANIFLITAYFENGDNEAALKAADHLRATTPFFQISHIMKMPMVRRESDFERISSALKYTGFE